MIKFQLKVRLTGDDLEEAMEDIARDFYIHWAVIEEKEIKISTLEQSIGALIPRLAAVC